MDFVCLLVRCGNSLLLRELAWKVCLWEKEAHVFSGSVSYRCLELCLFHLIKLWNVFCSGKIAYQAHPWKWAGFTSSPDFVKLHQDVVSWVPGVVFLSLYHQVCPRHELTVVSILLCYWLKKKNQPGIQLKDVKDNEKKKICHLARHVFTVIFPSVSSLYWFKGCLSWCFIVYRKEKNRLTKLSSLNKDTVNSKKLNLKDMWIFHVVCQAVILGWWL